MGKSGANQYMVCTVLWADLQANLYHFIVLTYRLFYTNQHGFWNGILQISPKA